MTTSGQVMDELAALVEKRRVVFVALDDEPLAVGETRALAEIVRDAADEKAGVQPVVLEHPGQQRSGGGFAVRAGDDQRAFAANEKFLQQFRQRAIAQFVVQHEFRLGVAARNGVADDHQVGFAGQIGFRVARHDLDFFGREERGHRRIDILVRAGDGEALVAHRRGDRRHGRAADADEMNRFDLRKHRRP